MHERRRVDAAPSRWGERALPASSQPNWATSEGRRATAPGALSRRSCARPRAARRMSSSGPKARAKPPLPSLSNGARPRATAPTNPSFRATLRSRPVEIAATTALARRPRAARRRRASRRREGACRSARSRRASSSSAGSPWSYSCHSSSAARRRRAGPSRFERRRGASQRFLARRSPRRSPGRWRRPRMGTPSEPRPRRPAASARPIHRGQAAQRREPWKGSKRFTPRFSAPQGRRRQGAPSRWPPAGVFGTASARLFGADRPKRWYTRSARMRYGAEGLAQDDPPAPVGEEPLRARADVLPQDVFVSGPGRRPSAEPRSSRAGRCVATFVFCLLAGAVYTINDLVDVEPTASTR
jgi:hypothetical protein